MVDFQAISLLVPRQDLAGFPFKAWSYCLLFTLRILDLQCHLAQTTRLQNCWFPQAFLSSSSPESQLYSSYPSQACVAAETQPWGEMSQSQNPIYSGSLSPKSLQVGLQGPLTQSLAVMLDGQYSFPYHPPYQTSAFPRQMPASLS